MNDPNLIGTSFVVFSNMYPSSESPYFGVFVRRTTRQLLASGWRLDALVVARRTRGRMSRVSQYARLIVRAFLVSISSRADFLICHFAVYSPIPPLLVRYLTGGHRPVGAIVTNVHGSDINVKGLRRRLVGWVLRHSDTIVAPSMSTKTYVSKRFLINEAHVLVYPSGGVSQDFFVAGQSAIMPTYFAAYVGNLTREKGLEMMLRAIASSPVLRNQRWLIAGDGPMRREIITTAEDEGLSSVIDFIGAVPPQHVPATMGRAKFIVFPTLRTVSETLGLVGVEAMATGRPLIASDIPATRDYLVDGVNGYKFKMGDSQQLSEVLELARTLTDAEYAVMSATARHTGKRYDSDAVTVAFSDNLRRRMKRPRRPVNSGSYMKRDSLRDDSTPSC